MKKMALLNNLWINWKWEKGVHSIIPYRENTKMNVRINKNELDEYLKDMTIFSNYKD